MSISIAPLSRAGSLSGVDSVPAAARSSTAAERSRALAVEQARRTDHLSGQYDAGGALRGGENAADDRTVNKLAARDRQVRATEAQKGEAVAGESYIFQRGPDGKLYAIGTRSHTVRKEEDDPSALTRPANPFDAGQELDAADRRDLEELRARDREVKAHEKEHMLAAGGQSSLPEYEYRTGPDGRRYAAGGSVNLSMESGGPSARRSALNAYRAAMAPGGASVADRASAAKALGAVFE